MANGKPAAGAAPHISRLDLRGLKCPLPALRTRKALQALPPDALLVVECTDPMSAIDIPHCAAEDGHRLEGQTAEGGVLTFQIRRSAA
jgi:tRNA 2-thiouridine synthesizing protein A